MFLLYFRFCFVLARPPCYRLQRFFRFECDDSPTKDRKEDRPSRSTRARFLLYVERPLK